MEDVKKRVVLVYRLLSASVVHYELNQTMTLNEICYIMPVHTAGWSNAAKVVVGLRDS